VAGKKKKKNSYNENWKSEIGAYDKKCRQQELDFYKNHIIIKDSGIEKLTKEENEILVLYLSGLSCSEIAKKFKIETELITSLMEIIKAKLSMDD